MIRNVFYKTFSAIYPLIGEVMYYNLDRGVADGSIISSKVFCLKLNISEIIGLYNSGRLYNCLRVVLGYFPYIPQRVEANQLVQVIQKLCSNHPLCLYVDLPFNLSKWPKIDRIKINCCYQNVNFVVLLRNRLISAGIKPVQSHTENSCIASY